MAAWTSYPYPGDWIGYNVSIVKDSGGYPIGETVGSFNPFLGSGGFHAFRGYCELQPLTKYWVLFDGNNFSSNRSGILTVPSGGGQGDWYDSTEVSASNLADAGPWELDANNDLKIQIIPESSLMYAMIPFILIFYRKRLQ
jgi:hypothetical protein